MEIPNLSNTIMTVLMEEAVTKTLLLKLEVPKLLLLKMGVTKLRCLKMGGFKILTLEIAKKCIPIIWSPPLVTVIMTTPL